jgi:hypothetical protein
MENKIFTLNEVMTELDKLIIGEELAKKTLLITTTGRLVKNAKPYSYHTLVKASSSSGKDHLVSSILGLLSKKDYLHRRRISIKNTDYLDSKEQMNKETWDETIIYLEDITEDVLNSESLKTRMSGDGEVSIVDNRKSKTLISKGKPTFILTTAESIPIKEIANRVFILNLDESKEQNRKVVDKIFSDSEEEDEEKNEINEDIKEFLASLNSYNVSIPFGKLIAPHFPTDETRARRNANRFADLIRAIAVFNQHNRKQNEKGWLIADLEDYDIAKEIFESTPQDIEEYGFAFRQEEIIQVLKKSDEPLLKAEIAKNVQTPISESNILKHLSGLVDLKVIEIINERDVGSRMRTKYALADSFGKDKRKKLPEGKDLEAKQ